ncbi:Swt1 family HEPN domain-containing protein [Salinibacillus xinjiangensis]|uniref:Swt1-like HEPN domain-containing protein n=1 Tax=Salinibacillus xinjiangensis TaxID=1229268 RepID=A0A6G1X6S2_9BACI|nr:Swt1 family HEPN domain-containing protein [Salinibacillus xinjiangensis]MRG86701.1 hypothetical protein [Salinibacillus xinjiangensis]
MPIEAADSMMIAYRKLYIIETSLRYVIQERMLEEYGPHWEFRASLQYLKRPSKSFHDMNLHELLNYFNTYPPLQKIFTAKQKVQLSHLTSIRNKIAHCKKLDNKEAQFLSELELCVKKVINSKILSTF